jgi:hypothetical protein
LLVRPFGAALGTGSGYLFQNFNVMSCGDTRQQALDALSEAVELFLETAQEMGTLETILGEVGYVAREGR